MNRAPLPDRVVERIRRERYAPRITQMDWLHLAGLRRALLDAFAELPVRDGPVLDLYCGTQPYRELLPWGPVWGLDLDRHFGRADVLGTVPLPFRDGAFQVALCTQALHLVDDPPATARELRRVLAPGGWAVVTVPHVFRREIPAERRLGAADLRELFAGWAAVQVRGFGAAGSAATYFPAGLAHGAARRWPPLRRLLPPAALAMNLAGLVLETVSTPVARRWPASFIVLAQRPAS